jgi:hypothetical protein
MATAKDIRVAFINAADATALVKRVHYSGKVVQNSQLHFGVFLDGKLEGAMQFGPSMDKRHIQGLVADTPWHSFIELNRRAFSDKLPRNSESRAIGVAMRMLRKHYPQLQWVVSFADGTQCGDGTIYRASGFVLTGITKNSTIYEFPDGERVSNLAIKTGREWQRKRFGKEIYGEEALREAKRLGAKPVAGYMLRYIYFLDPTARERLTVPVIPFSEIQRRGASMYRGQKREKVGREESPSSDGGATPTFPLQDSAKAQ